MAEGYLDSAVGRKLMKIVCGHDLAACKMKGENGTTTTTPCFDFDRSTLRDPSGPLLGPSPAQRTAVE